MGLKHTLGRLTETLFFDTDKRLYWREQTFGIASEAFRIPGSHESTLSGKVFHAESVTSENSRGLIVYAGAPVKNLSFNLPQILWIPITPLPKSSFLPLLQYFHSCASFVKQFIKAVNAALR